MIVLGISLGDPLRTRLHPVQIVGEPPSHSTLLRGRKFQRDDEAGGPRHFHQVQRIDNPKRASRRDPMNSLGVLKVRVHPRIRSNEPGAQVIRRTAAVPAISRQPPRRRQRRHLQRERDHRLAVIVEVIRVTLPVTVHVRPVRIRRIRPEVVSLRKEVVHTPGAFGRAERGNRHRLHRQGTLPGRRDARPVHRRNQRVRRAFLLTSGRQGQSGRSRGEAEFPCASVWTYPEASSRLPVDLVEAYPPFLGGG